mgnify:CR=1 FL=1
MWKYFVELECERELAKLEGWNRERAKESTFVAPYVSPPQHFVIQGLMPAPASNKSNSSETVRCRDCEFHLKIGGCVIKRRIGYKQKGYCPLRFSSRRTSAMMPEEKPKAPRMPAENELCRNCDFLDKVKGSCLIQRFGGICVHVKAQKPESHKKPCRFCDYYDKVKNRCGLELIGESCIYGRLRNAKPLAKHF